MMSLRRTCDSAETSGSGSFIHRPCFHLFQAECIVLRERKLNIAPAIKKQPFSRSFEGSTGSPPSVPTSTYYYANGMSLLLD